MSDPRPAPDAPVVAMFVRNQFRHDARVVREATTLIEEGFAVTVFAVTLDEAEAARAPEMQGSIRVVRVTLPTVVQRFIQLLMRIVSLYARIASIPRRIVRIAKRARRMAKRAWFILRLPPDEALRRAAEHGPRARKAVAWSTPLARAARLAWRLPADAEFPEPPAPPPGEIARKPPLTVGAVNAARIAIRNALWPSHRALQARRFARVTGRMAAELRPVAYHAHDLNALPAAFAARKHHRAPIIYDAHELWPHRNRPDARARKTWVAEKGDRFYSRRCDSVITVNESLAEHMRQRYGLREVVVIRNTPKLGARVAPPSHGMLDDVPRPRLMYVGGIQTNRGLEELIAATALIPDATLVAMGPGTDAYRASLEELCDAHGVRERVRFVPFVPHDAVVQTIAQGDIGFALIKNYCLSYYLSLPNKFFEYCHAGLPVISSNFPEMQRLVERYEVGATCDPADPVAIARTVTDLLARPDELERMRANTRKAAEELNWEREREHLLGLYRRLVPAERWP